MRILFVADVVGKPGRRALKELLMNIKNEKEADLTIVNCENAAGGFGVTRDIVEEIYGYGADVLTSGNHIWDKKDIEQILNDYETLLRPANYPYVAPGRGSVMIPVKGGIYVGVLNLAGRVFMQSLDCPFVRAKEYIATVKGKTNIIFVDMHAEATSEKIALAYYLDGEVSAVIGTHTHVQTADERILPGGTAFLSDAGMTGPFDSIIGMQKEAVLERFLKQLPNRLEVANGDIRLQGVIVDVEEATGKAKSIERINAHLKKEALAN